MTRQEIQELITELKRKKAAKEPLTDGEMVILDVHRGLLREGKEITERGIGEIKFWMD